jgi:sporulation protein YlmC with PRC-barrel domain
MSTLVTVVAALTSSVLVFTVSPAFAQPRQSAETTHPTFTPPPASLLSRTVIGARVKNAEGKDLGEIDQLVIDLKSGQVSHAVIGVGGLAGVGETTVVVKWSDLRIQPDPTNPRRTITTVDQAVVERAPRWDRRAQERDRMPPAASPATIPPSPAPRLTPGRQH